MYLPTLTSARWAITALRDSIKEELRADKQGTELLIFAYAVTLAGWRELRTECVSWIRRNEHRRIVLYVGTDHALTDPEALQDMLTAGIQVRLMRKYRGVFHPKVFWLKAPRLDKVWIGSNNFTREGLRHNVEFASILQTARNPSLVRWHKEIHDSSEDLTPEYLASYTAERREFSAKRAAAPGAFTWSKKEEPSEPPARKAPASSGARRTLVIQVMPKETGADGKQIQLPKEAAVGFFGLANRVGASSQIELTPLGTGDSRQLSMKIFQNNTVRLTINELDYRDRPCLLVFRPIGRNRYDFEIVQESIFPSRYRRLLARCGNQTRPSSRKWMQS